MPLKLKTTGQRSALPLKMVADAVSYRLPMSVVEIRLYHDAGYPVCPRCDSSFDREYTQFCDRCGQRLAWGFFRFAAIRTAGKK